MSPFQNLTSPRGERKYTDTSHPDEAEVRKTHFKYGYYLDKCLYNEVVDMFADHPDTYVEFLGSRYRGKAGVKRLYQGRFQNMFVKGRNGPVHGFLLDHIMMQDIVDVDSTGTHAWVRMRALMSAGTVCFAFLCTVPRLPCFGMFHASVVPLTHALARFGQ